MSNRELFGEIAVRKGYCGRTAIRRALCRQRSLRKHRRHMLIGMIMLEQGAIDNSQLIEILRCIQMLRPNTAQSMNIDPGMFQPFPLR